MKAADVISCGLVTLFGLVLLFVIIPGWVPVEAGPGFGLAATTMPNVAIITLTALAAMFFTYRVRNRQPRSETDKAYDSTPPVPRKSWTSCVTMPTRLRSVSKSILRRSVLRDSVLRKSALRESIVRSDVALSFAA